MSSELKEKAAQAYSKGKFAKAAELYQEYCASEPKDHQSRVRLGDAWSRAGKVPQAIAAYRLSAEGFAKEGFLPRAIAAAKLILEIDPAHLEVQQMIANLYARKRGPTKAAPGAAASPEPTKEVPQASPDNAIELEAPSDDFAPMEIETAGGTIQVPAEPKAASESVIELDNVAEPAPEAVAALEEEVIELDAVVPEPPRFDELELDMEVASAALWPGPTKPAIEEASADSLLEAVERAAELAAQGPWTDVEPASVEPVNDARRGLPEIPLFSELDRDAFLALFHRCPLRRANPGDRIVTQGEQGNSFFVICAGSVRVLRDDNGQSRNIAEVGEGGFFGEMALLSGAPRAASVEASADDTQLLEISAPVLSEVAAKYPGVAKALKRFGRQRMLANVMETSALFNVFDRKERKAMARRFLASDAPAGEVLIQEGHESDGLYVVLSGEVEVRKQGAPVALLREGELFGEMSLLNKAAAEATVTARRKTALLRLPRNEFDALILSHPQVLVLVSELTEARRKQLRSVP